ncbi:MAG TPA: FkbM family methyltransferase [Salinivirgaceae bacterium]|nr:FkbM family methyltransferase [Salinivirgaceae bacterium]HQA75650.1 FkbM family methyltransferase [Salinivirgaceae bacterium]
MSIIKNTIREILIFLHLDLTKNLKYDRLTKKILKKHLKRDSNCIDVGCHKGEILDLMLCYAPDGKHYAFEPIPYLFNNLKTKYKNKKVEIFPYALSDNSGESTFQLVKNAPAYSGIKKRRYDISNPDIEEIKVTLKTLDEIIPADEQIHLIKIDVEGGEFGVLKGAKDLLKKNKPTIIFECGKGGSDYYGTTPNDLYDFISNEIGLKIYTLQSFVKNKQPIDKAGFERYFNTNKEYYFIANADENKTATRKYLFNIKTRLSHRLMKTTREENNYPRPNYNKLFEGVRGFKSNEHIPKKEFFAQLGKHQNPHTLYIGCSDSRVVPNLVTGTIPGELFVVRNIGNFVPLYDRNKDTFVATSAVIEYAVKQLQVNNIVVCGHSNCGGCAALYSSAKEMRSLPHTKKWLELAAPVKKIVEEQIEKNLISAEDRGVFTEQMNVVVQIEHLMQYPYIRKAVKNGDITIMGWWYHIEEGEIYDYDFELKRFIKVE